MTDVIYLDEYGNAVDDGAEIHELIDRITDMLASMTKAERMNWFSSPNIPTLSILKQRLTVRFIQLKPISTVWQVRV